MLTNGHSVFLIGRSAQLFASSTSSDSADPTPTPGGLRCQGDCVAKRADFLLVGLRWRSAVDLFRPSIEGLSEGAAASRDGYVRQATVAAGGRNSSFASRRRFCTVAVSNTSSLAPLRPRSRRRSSLKMRFI